MIIKLSFGHKAVILPLSKLNEANYDEVKVVVFCLLFVTCHKWLIICELLYVTCYLNLLFETCYYLQKLVPFARCCKSNFSKWSLMAGLKNWKMAFWNMLMLITMILYIWNNDPLKKIEFSKHKMGLFCFKIM